MAQGRSTKIISMIEWIWIRSLSVKNSSLYAQLFQFLASSSAAFFGGISAANDDPFKGL